MRYGTFLSEVERVAGLPRDEAERATRAVLETLGERITRGEAEDIARFLPRELRPLLENTSEPAERFDIDEFLRRVAEREGGIDRDAAAEHTRAVFVALGQAVAPGELRDMAAQLPKEFEPFLEAAGAGRSDAMADQDLVERIARIALIPRDRAESAAKAVLQTLAERISAGEAEDLRAELPARLRPAIDRGLERHREATVMTADEFVATVAELEGVSLEDAENHVRAVFQALRETVSSKEFSDMAAQLSRDYEPLLAAAR